MVIEKQAGHIAFQLEHDETVFELGYKVLLKQEIKHTLSGIRVQYNLKDRMMYDIENLQTMEECYDTMSSNMALQIMVSLLQVMKEVANNGFILPEAVQVSRECIFWNSEEQSAYFIVLPIAKEFATNDHRSFQKKFRDTMQELSEKLDIRTSELILELLGRPGKMLEQINAILQMLEKNMAVIGQNERIQVMKKQMELRLIHNGMYGQIMLLDKKKEYVIGKKRDSVDGYLGISNAVSRIHCKIVRHSDKFFILDLGSSNHTYVNSMMLYPEQEKELLDGTKVRIADIDFTVRIS